MEKVITQKTNKDIDNSAVLIEILYGYIRHWKWILASVVVALIIAGGVVLVSSKEYNSSLSVLLNEDKNTRNSSEFIDLESLGFLSTTSNIENEIIVLSSPDLMNLVVKSLNLSISYYQRSLFREIEIYKQTPFSVDLASDSTSFMGSCDFHIKKTSEGYEIKGTYFKDGDNLGIDVKEKELPSKLVLDEKNSLKITFTGKPIIENEKYYIRFRNLESTTANFISKLSVTNTGQKTSVLKLSLLTNNTEKGADVLKEIVHQYNEQNSRINNEMAYNTALFINDRLKEISLELSDAEEDVVEYKQQYKITDLSTEAQLFVSQTGVNEQKLMDIETQLNVLNYIQDFIDNPKNQFQIVPNMGVSDIGLSQIISEYNNRLLASDQLLKGAGEKNPARIRLSEELENMRSGISNSLANVQKTYTVSKDDLLRRSNITQSRIRSVPKQEKGLIEKVREQKIKENLFLFLMQKREETNLSIAATAGKARIVISPRTNILPVAPKSKVILLAFVILGVLIPIVIIYVRDLFRTQIRSRDEFERFSNVAIIGEIGAYKGGEEIVARNQTDAIAEMFRSLRNNIRFAWRTQEALSILVTSTIAKEGKTFISLNLALSFAYTGKKVLLIGGDIRKPRLQKYLLQSYQNTKGLSDYIIDENIKWDELIFTPYEDVNELQVLTAGTIPPNPNELLMSSRVKELIEHAKTKYDYVIVDSAPVGLVSDSYLIGENTDITLYIVREGKTPKSATNFINMQQDEQKFKKLYVVLNDTELGSSYKYGYGKEYGYGGK